MSPNPAKDMVNIEFKLNEKSTTLIQLFDLNGKQIKSLMDSELASGSYNLNFNVRDLDRGIYLVRTVANENVVTTKLVVQ